MKAGKLALLSLGVLLVASCQDGKQDATQLQTTMQTRDPRVVVQTDVTCTDVSDVCGRLYEEHGASCLRLTESADPATRAGMRSCAIRDFHQALAHLPPASDKLLATRGLAEALRINRDNTPDASVRAANTAELGSVAVQLQSLPGGAPYGGYYAAENDLNRVLTRNVPANQACATLKSAQMRLPSSNSPDDLKPRVADLNQQMTVAMRNRGCG